MAVMASRRRRRREGAGKRARRLSLQALASKLASGCSGVATARAHLPGSSDGDGEADVEPATKKWSASERMPWHGEQASTGNGKQLDWPQFNSQIRAVGSFASQKQRLNYLCHTVGMLHQHEKTTGQAMSVEIK